MAALASVLVVSVVSLLITRVATVALITTGMSREAARFQARSALSGVGYTTTEAESVVEHPVRRRIVMALMLVGSAGIATAVAALAISFVNADRTEAFTRVGVLAAGLFTLLAVARSQWVDQRLTRLIARALDRWTDLPARDYANLLHLSDDYVVQELAVCDGDWLAGRTIAELRLRDEGVAVLGVQRAAGPFLGAPHFDTRIGVGDVLVLYGRREDTQALGRRPAGPEGDRAHEAAVERRRARDPRLD